MSINAHKEGPPRFVIGLGTRAIQISSVVALPVVCAFPAR